MTSSDTNHDFPRIEPRYRLNDGIAVRVLVQPQGSPEPVDAHLVDMSNSGLQLRLSTCLKFDESMAVHILAGDLQFDLAATVKWIRQADEQSWFIGCRIKPELSEDALHRLASMGLLDRRESVRKQVEMPASICGELETAQTPAVIRNLSEDGFGLATLVARIVGQRIRVAVPTPYGETIDVTSRVIWQIKTNRGFFCGCAFLNRESHGQLIEVASGEENAAGRARRRRRRPMKRTSMWVALAALVVFVFPSLIVVLVGTGATQTALNDSSSASSAASAAALAAGERRTSDFDETSESAASETATESSTTGENSATGEKHPPTVETPVADKSETTTSAGQDDLVNPPTEFAPLVAQTRENSPDTTLTDAAELPPEMIERLGGWLDEAFDFALASASELDHAARQASVVLAHSSAEDIDATDTTADTVAQAAEANAESIQKPAAATEQLDGGFRTWVDSTGKHRVVARIESVENGEVRLLKENGRLATVPLERLSKEDGEYVRQWAKLPRP